MFVMFGFVFVVVVCFSFFIVFFFFKQKTAYEMRISDWSSDVCSSDLFEVDLVPGSPTRYRLDGRERDMVRVPVTIDVKRHDGTVESRTPAFYETVPGPIYVDVGSGLTRGGPRAYALGDRTIDNFALLDVWPAFARPVDSQTRGIGTAG